MNVWTTAKSANDRLPVIVWNYGGGFTGGSGSLPGYDGEALAKKGVVVVTYNYRLGIFGFLAHPELTAESGHHASGNYGMMDALAVLRWVQKNIAAFGGDPRRVTIDGDSAGAMSVGDLMISPQAKGLFARAIAESGGPSGLSINPMRKMGDAEQAGVKTAESLNAKSLAELRDRICGASLEPTSPLWGGRRASCALAQRRAGWGERSKHRAEFVRTSHWSDLTPTRSAGARPGSGCGSARGGGAEHATR